ncbi:serine carboxypeptidase S28 [Xylariales sp. AK1849]|nr:serine carboxypeptidase S28 [Xylariales sp. AK1849]
MTQLLDSAVTRVGNGTFTQPIDHNNTSLGSFPMSYYYNATNWKGPGSPIIIFTPGESAAAPYTGYLTERTLTGMFAKAVGGAVILIEHRYWGDSNPYPNQTTTHLQYLNLDQAIADFVNFAHNASLPFDTTGQSNAEQAPWVWVGGSYSGALSAWIEKMSPGTFWAYHATSGPVQAIYDFWEYYYPIQQGMPQNCSADYSAIIDHVDNVFVNGTDEEKVALKQMFAVEDLEHDDDAASAISSPIWSWQSIQFYSGYSTFYQMCDAIEGFTPDTAGTYTDGGVGLSKALPNFAAWFTSNYLPGSCESYGYEDWSGEMNVQCFNTYNSSMEVFHDWSDENAFDRPWIWMTCNEPLFYWQTGAPEDTPTVMSRLADATYYQRQCKLWFPPEDGYTFASDRGVREDYVNNRTSGWFNTQTTRLVYVNGQYDPWRSASVSSEFRPGGPFNGTEDVPLFLIEGGIHCSDLLEANAVNPSVAAIQKAAIAQISEWVDEFDN